MRTFRILAMLSIALVAHVATAQTTCCPTHTPGGASIYEVTQQFPSKGPMKTAWLVQWSIATHVGLYITGAWFRRTPAEPWMRILWDGRVSEIFVPYHDGDPWRRFYDLRDFSWQMAKVTPEDLGCCGKQLGDYVVREVRDRGPLWKDHHVSPPVYRGEELVLWATMMAGNYDYMMQYIFRDDGSIGFRLGATAQNLPSAPWTTHMHNGLWRVDVDLAGFPNDTALAMSHHETPAGLSATDKMDPFNGGIEGSLDWDPLEFTEVAVRDEVVKNGRSHNIQYDLMPMRAGNARHNGPNEEFTQHDFWVTRYDPAELFYPQVADYVKAKRPVTNTDVVLWHAASLHHMPRDEDGMEVDGVWVGSALVMFAGFDLRPRNFFDTTPFYP